MAKPTQRRTPNQLRYSWLLLSVFLLSLVYALSGHGQLPRLNGALQDTSSWLHQRPASPDIVIVAIDDRSIEAIGRWPWRRALHAAALDHISAGQPQAVGLDIVFSEEDRDYPGDDLLLQRALQKSARTVLPLTRSAQAGLHQPLPSLGQAARALGHTQMPVDADGLVRRFYAIEGPPSAPQWHMALSLHCVARTGQACQPPSPANLPTEAEPRQADSRWLQRQPEVIAFAAPQRSRGTSSASTFVTYSYIDVLRGAIPAAAFRGKYVLIGTTATGLGEKFTAAVGLHAQSISNVEVLGHVLSGIELDQHLKPASSTLNRTLNLLPILLALLALSRFGPSAGLLACAALAALVLIVAGLAPRWGHIQTAPAAALIGLGLAYPLWSWLRLRSAAQFLALELRDLQQQGLPVSLAQPRTGDALDQRISAVEQASQQLRSMHHFVSESLRQLPSPTFVISPSGQVMLANTAAHRYIQSLGHTLEHGHDLVALLAGLVSSSGAGQALLQMRDLQSAQLPPQAEGRDAHGRSLMLLSQPFATASTAGWLITLVDISELRSAQAQRDQAMQFISHDIRTPIGSIITLLEMERSSGAAEAVAQPHAALFDRIESYAQSSLQLADDFVHLARAQQQQYRQESLDLGTLADQAVNDSWTAAQRNGLSLHFELPEQESLVQGDPGLLYRAVLNLLSNAIKYGQPASATAPAAVECEVVEHPEHWGISVRDHGRGMDAASLARLTQPFERLAQHQRMDGVGLGLAFVRTVAQRHGGELRIHSEPGLGSCFTLLIPKA